MGAVIRANSRLSSAEAIARRLPHLGGALVISTDRDRFAAAQLGSPGQLAIGEIKPSARLLELSLRCGKIDLEGARVDDEEQIALLDELPVLEVNLRQIAADPRAHLDRFRRHELAGVLVPVDDLAHQRRTDRHRGWCSRLRRRPMRLAKGADRCDGRQQTTSHYGRG
jgi:hypothetical protein